MGQACNSNANNNADPAQQPEAAHGLASPVPGSMALSGVPERQEPKRASRNQQADWPHPVEVQAPPCDPHAPCGGVEIEPCGPCGPCDSSPVYIGQSGVEPVGTQMPAEYYQPQVCEGPNCPQANYTELYPSVYQSLSNPDEILFGEDYDGGWKGAQHQPAEEIRASRLSQAEETAIKRDIRANQRMSQGSQRRSQSHAQADNNIIVAAAIEAPEQAELAEEPAPVPEKKQKKKRRRLFRKKKNNRGADEGQDYE